MKFQQQKRQFLSLSNELICSIFQFLPLQDILTMSTLCHRLYDVACRHFQLCKSVDLAEDSITGHITRSITDHQLEKFLKRCPSLEIIYGLTPCSVSKNSGRNPISIGVQSVVHALQQCPRLKAVETSDLMVAEAVLCYLPHVKIFGHFRNHDRQFMAKGDSRMKLPPDPNMASLHVSEIDLENLPAMPRMEHLYLEAVRFKQDQPFEEFYAPNLRTCVVRYCAGSQTRNLQYLPFLGALSGAHHLVRLEFVGLSNLGNSLQLFSQQVIPSEGFRQLTSLVISGCKDVTDTEIGYLVLAANKTLKSLVLQPSLSTDRFFVALKYSQAAFPSLELLHLGIVDDNPVQGFEEDSGNTTEVTDAGVKVIAEIFTKLNNLCIENCPYLQDPSTWTSEGGELLKHLEELRLSQCLFIHVASFALFLSYLPTIKVIILKRMFNSCNCQSLPLGAADLSRTATEPQAASREDSRDEHLSSDIGRHENLDSSAASNEKLTSGYHNATSSAASEVHLDECQRSDELHTSSEPGPYCAREGVSGEDPALHHSVSPGIIPDSTSAFPSEPEDCDKNNVSLRVVSETLVSLTLISCGISKVVIDSGHSLVHLEVIACSNFHQVRLTKCPTLKKLHVALCPKLDLDVLVAQVLSLPPAVRMVFIEPDQQRLYDHAGMETLIFGNLNRRSHLYLLHDYSPDTLDGRAKYRESMLKKLAILQTVQSNQSHVRSVESTHDYPMSYPWERLAISLLCGTFPDGHYELLTDNPVMREVWWGVDYSCTGFPEDTAVDLEQNKLVMDNMIMMALDFKDCLNTYVGHTAFYIHVIERNEVKIS